MDISANYYFHKCNYKLNIWYDAISFSKFYNNNLTLDIYLYTLHSAYLNQKCMNIRNLLTIEKKKLKILKYSFYSSENKNE